MILRENTAEKANLTILFDKYIPIMQDIMSKRFKKITPIPGMIYMNI
jgi:dynein heavy chain